MIVGDKKFENYTYVMAIINLTPDSFWAQSRKTCDQALFAAEQALKDGAAIIDLGAQSTRPGYCEVSAECELERLIKPLRAIKERLDIPVSVDTYYAGVAAAALSEGADMINDVWGLSRDENIARVIARNNASVCIMHNAAQKITGDIWDNVKSFLADGAQRALAAGIAADRICLDGGIGFAKDREQNFELLEGYERLSCLGYPLLLGTSRKSMFGGNVEDRLPQTLQSTRLAVEKNVLFVRVHDVKENVRTIKESYERYFD